MKTLPKAKPNRSVRTKLRTWPELLAAAGLRRLIVSEFSKESTTITIADGSGSKIGRQTYPITIGGNGLPVETPELAAGLEAAIVRFDA